MTDRGRVIAWLTEHPLKGYRACSRELGLPIEQVTAWGKEHRGTGSVMGAAARAHEPAPRPPPKPPANPDTPAGMSRVQFAEWQLAAAVEDLEKYRGEERSGTAVAALHRTVLDLSRDLAAVRAEAERAGKGEGKDTTPEDLRAAVFAASEQEFVVLLEAIEERRASGKLRVVR